MAQTNRFIPHSVLVGASTWINGVGETSIDPGVTLIEESAGSETDREFVAAGEIAPTLPFDTTDLSILSTVGFAGVPSANASSTFTVFGRELPLGALPTAVATTNHITVACTDGLLVPVSVRASHNQAARLQLILYGVLGTGLSSSATPFVETSGVAITSGAGAVTNVYTTGAVKYTVNGGASKLVVGISDETVNFGIRCLREGDSGEVYPTHVSIISRMTTFEFTTKDATLIAAVGDGLDLSSFAMYFRKLTSDGQRVASATTSHVGITATKGMLTPGGTRLRHKAPGEATFTFTPAKNTNLITISTSSAIPTS